MSKSVDIVGAGIAGLSVGCYLQMNGYRTQIFERHELPGGLCTSWKRGGYTFDNCVQWLLGSAPGVRLHDAWQELGALPGPRIVDHEEFLRVVGADGAMLVLYTDVDRLERHLRELSPEDSRHIHELTNLIRRQVGFDLPLGKPPELRTPLDRLKVAVRMLPSTWSFVAVRPRLPPAVRLPVSQPVPSGGVDEAVRPTGLPAFWSHFAPGVDAQACGGIPNRWIPRVHPRCRTALLRPRRPDPLPRAGSESRRTLGPRPVAGCGGAARDRQ